MTTTVQGHAARSRSWGKFHLITGRDDHAAICGKEADCVGSFGSQLGDEHLEWAIAEDMVCKSCLKRTGILGA